jgi:hypothetical protein
MGDRGPTPIIVIEKVYAARPQLQDLVDLAVLVETPAEERQRRLIVRGGGDDARWPRWCGAEDHYYTTICPRQLFDLVIPAPDRRSRIPVVDPSLNGTRRRTHRR